MTNYNIGDFLIQIKNAAQAEKREVSLPRTKLVEASAKVLKKEGILEEVKVKDGELTTRLAYHKKEPMLLDLKIVSTPGLRVYAGFDELSARRSASWLLLSTSQGVMASGEAVKKKIGGEVIAEIL